MPQPPSKARLVITALFVDRQTPAEVAARYGVHRAWVYKLKARYEAEGDAAFEPRSRRPKTTPTALDPALVDLIVRVRKELAEAGLDAGPETIGWHLTHHHRVTVSRATISRTLTRQGLVTPEPKKRPRVVLHQVRGGDAQRDLAVRLHPLPPHQLRWQPRRRRRDHHLARRLHPLRPAHQRPRPDHHRHRQDHLPQSRRSARHPGVHPDRQRHGLHRPILRRQAVAATPSNKSSTTGTWSRRTPDPATPGPTGRSSGSSRP